jgi:hypothetical protein
VKKLSASLHLGGFASGSRAMIFCIFFDPACVKSAVDAGPLGLDHLLGIFRCMLENCLLAETIDTYRVGLELAEAVQAIPETAENLGARKRVVALLESLKLRRRFAPVLEDDPERYDAPLTQIAQANRNNPNLDAVITALRTDEQGLAEVVLFASFHQSHFAARRQKAACGTRIEPGKLSAKEFFALHLARLLLVCRQFHIVDSVIGKEFAGNFHEALPHWIEFFKTCNEMVELTIHTTGKQTSSVKAYLKQLCIDTRISPDACRHEDLPHERYLTCEAFSFLIGRGIDLFDRDGMCRDLDIKFSDYRLP